MDLIHTKHTLKAFSYKRFLVALLIISLNVVPTPALASELQYYTVLAGSYSSVENAEIDYLEIQDTLSAKHLDSIRIELVGGYYTIRFGKYREISRAEEVLAVVEEYFKGARILYAYVRPERIVKSFDSFDNSSANSSGGIQSDIRAIEPFTIVNDLMDEESRSVGSEDSSFNVDPYFIKEKIQQLQGKVYSVQFGSFTKKELAYKEFKRIHSFFEDDPIPWLRLERIQSFYTIRAGRFQTEKSADEFSDFVGENGPIPTVLRTYIKPERVEQIIWVDGQSRWESFEVMKDDPQKNITDTNPTPVLKDYQEEIIESETITIEKSIEPDGGSLESPKAEEKRIVKRILADKQKKKVTKTQKDLLKNLKVDPGQEFFTVQIASFSEIALATREYELFQTRFEEELLYHLRIEFIKGFFAVRVGKFDSREEAEQLLTKLQDTYPQTSIVYAYIIDERIQRLFGDTSSTKQYLDNLNDQIPVESIGSIDSFEENTVDTIASSENISAENSNLDNRHVDTNIDAKNDQANPAENIVDNTDLGNASSETIDVTGQQDQLYVSDSSTVTSDIEVNEIVIHNDDVNESNSITDTVYDNNDPETFSTVLANDSDTLVEKTTEESEQEETPASLNSQPDMTNTGSLAEQDIEEENVEFSYEVITVLTKDDKGESIRMPSSLFYDDANDELYLINGVNNRIIIYGPDYFAQNSLGKGRGLDSPLSGCFTDDRKVFITQAGTPTSKPRLSILNSAFFVENEIFMQDMPESEDFIPQKVIQTADKSLYITGLNSRKILVLSPEGTFKKWFEIAVDKRGDYVFSDATKPVKTAKIKDIRIDSEGNFVVLSEETSKAYVFDKNETFLFSFGRKGGAEGKLSRPRGLAIDEKRRCFYVVDYMRHTVLIYDFNGNFKFEFGGRGWGPEWFNYPVDIEVGRQGTIIVADFFNQRAQVFEIKFRDDFPEKSPEKWRLQ